MTCEEFRDRLHCSACFLSLTAEQRQETVPHYKSCPWCQEWVNAREDKSEEAAIEAIALGMIDRAVVAAKKGEKK